MPGKPIIVWYEDEPGKIARQIAYAKKFFTVKIVNAPHDFLDILEEEGVNVAAVIVDILLRGNQDLSPFGIKNPDDDAFEAGWLIVDQCLRRRGAPEIIRNIPICLVSSRTLTEEQQQMLADIRKRGGGSLAYIEKFFGNWDSAFKEWLGAILRSKRRKSE